MAKRPDSRLAVVSTPAPQAGSVPPEDQERVAGLLDAAARIVDTVLPQGGNGSDFDRTEMRKTGLELAFLQLANAGNPAGASREES